MAYNPDGDFTIHVPLDASGIKDFTPDKGVKVVALDSEGTETCCHTLQLFAHK